jgi:ADP-ribose pyrophosphatase YjhB (NUDIX family)
LEPGEQPALAAVREVLEETRIHAVAEGLATVSSSPETFQYENDDRAQYLDLTFLCRAVGTEDPQVADDESTAVGWFEAYALSPDELVARTYRPRDGLPHTRKTGPGSPARSPCPAGTVRACGEIC